MASVATSTAIRNAVVTGANRGIGLEICKQLATVKPPNDYTSIYALCRKSNNELQGLTDTYKNIKIIENIELVGKEEELSTLIKTTFGGGDDDDDASITPISLLVHNSGAYGPPNDIPKDTDSTLYKSQSLETITSERMRYAYEINTIAPLYLTKLLLPNLLKVAAAAQDVVETITTTKRTSDGNTKNGSSSSTTTTTTPKVIIISSVMGSIKENTSGAHYAYRASKAAINMVGKSLAIDLKDQNIAVGMVHPGYVYTGFNGMKTPKQAGQRDVEESVQGVIEAIDSINRDNTGAFLHGNYGEGVLPLQW